MQSVLRNEQFVFFYKKNKVFCRYIVSVLYFSFPYREPIVRKSWPHLR